MVFLLGGTPPFRPLSPSRKIPPVGCPSLHRPGASRVLDPTGEACEVVRNSLTSGLHTGVTVRCRSFYVLHHTRRCWSSLLLVSKYGIIFFILFHDVVVGVIADIILWCVAVGFGRNRGVEGRENRALSALRTFGAYDPAFGVPREYPCSKQGFPQSASCGVRGDTT